MWYFAWILGLGLAATVGILNALWFEMKSMRHEGKPGPNIRLEPAED